VQKEEDNTTTVDQEDTHYTPDTLHSQVAVVVPYKEHTTPTSPRQPLQDTLMPQDQDQVYHHKRIHIQAGEEEQGSESDESEEERENA